MEFLSGVPGWAWAVLFFVGIIFAYGVANRRWREEERREEEMQKKAQEHAGRTPAAELKVKDKDGEEKETK